MPLDASSLPAATERLYVAFAGYHARHPVDGCPCCVSDEDKALLQAAPLRRLTPEQLSRYAFKALTTWGDVSDFKHFFPRLLELSLSPLSGLPFDLLVDKLFYARWGQWPNEEWDAVQQFLAARWHDLLRQERLVLPASEFLQNAMRLGAIAPYVDAWHGAPGLDATLRLDDLVLSDADAVVAQVSASRGLTPWEQAINELLRKSWVRTRLENAFFAAPNRESQTFFSQAVQRLDWLEQVS